jgi:plasmid stability protein
MASLVIRNVPAAVHHALKQRAEANRRSLNGELLALLQSAFAPARVRPFPDPIDVRGELTPEEIIRAKRAGRT